MVEPGIRREKLQRPRGRSRASKSEALLSASPAASTFLAAGPTLPRALAPIKLQLIPMSNYVTCTRQRRVSLARCGKKPSSVYLSSFIIAHRSHPQQSTGLLACPKPGQGLHHPISDQQNGKRKKYRSNATGIEPDVGVELSRMLMNKFRSKSGMSEFSLTPQP